MEEVSIIKVYTCFQIICFLSASNLYKEVSCKQTDTEKKDAVLRINFLCTISNTEVYKFGILIVYKLQGLETKSFLFKY